MKMKKRIMRMAQALSSWTIVTPLLFAILRAISSLSADVVPHYVLDI